AGPGQAVAVLLSRSAEAIVAIMAVLKTGAAYLPIDPAHPDARIKFVVEDAAPIAVLPSSRLVERLTAYDVPIIDVDDSAIAAQPSTGLPLPSPDDLAHI